MRRARDAGTAGDHADLHPGKEAKGAPDRAGS
jgi:hypothetical protein